MHSNSIESDNFKRLSNTSLSRLGLIAVGLVGLYCFRVGLIVLIVRLIVLFVNNIVSGRMSYCLQMKAEHMAYYMAQHVVIFVYSDNDSIDWTGLVLL